MARKCKSTAIVAHDPPSSPWSQLPFDIRYIIFECLYQDCRRQVSEKETRKLRKKVGSAPSATGQAIPRASTYAIVNKEWQGFFESRIFHRLIVTQSDLDDVEYILRPESCRRALVKHIWLNIELIKYGCGAGNGTGARWTGGCRTFEPLNATRRNETAFYQGVRELMRILSSWKLGKDNSGLTLEISAHSPSDSEHYFNLDRYRRDYDPYKFSDEYYHGTLEMVQGGRGEHCWHPSRIFQHATCDHTRDWLAQTLSHAIGREPLGWPWLEEGVTFPHADVAVNFLIRRQFMRLFEPACISDILTCLPNVQDIRIEQWRFPDKHLPRAFDMSLVGLVLTNLLKKNVKSVALFEDTDPYALEKPFGRSRHTDILSKTVAQATRHLEHLHCAVYVDANDFFWAFKPVDGKFQVCPGFVHQKHSFSAIEAAAGKKVGKLDPPLEFDLDEFLRTDIPDDWMEEPMAAHANGTKNLEICDCQAEWVNIETLSLTSRILAIRSSASAINTLLHAAANAASRMPRLKAMEIWNFQGFRFSNDKQGFIFIYRVEDCRHASITVKCSWTKFPLSKLVQAKWHKVARQGRRTLTINTEYDEDLGSRVIVLKELALKNRLLHPVSAFELLR